MTAAAKPAERPPRPGQHVQSTIAGHWSLDVVFVVLRVLRGGVLEVEREIRGGTAAIPTRLRPGQYRVLPF